MITLGLARWTPESAIEMGKRSAKINHVEVEGKMEIP